MPSPAMPAPAMPCASEAVEALSPSPSPARELEQEHLNSIKQRMAQGFSPKALGAAMAFRPEPTDVLVASVPKSGTTWMIQIVQSLRSGGDLSFDDLNDVVPFMEAAEGLQLGPLDAPQAWSPRAYKTHMPYPCVPKGFRKMIYVARDPLDTAPSLFHFFQGWHFGKGEVSPDAFVREMCLPPEGSPCEAAAAPALGCDQWRHMASWFAHRADPNVLWIHYEDLKADLPAAVRLVAQFIGAGAGDAALKALAVRQASLEHMRAHESKYDEHRFKLLLNTRMGLPAAAGMDRRWEGKVRVGAVGRNGDELSPEMRVAFQEQWDRVMLPATGYASYEEMRRGINRELGRAFWVQPNF